MSITDMLTDLDKAGAKPLPPNQAENEFTLDELAQGFHHSAKSSEFKAYVDKLVSDGTWAKGERMVKSGKKRHKDDCYWKVT